jgi:hypothetical protein
MARFTMLAAILAVTTAGCAAGLRSPRILDVERTPARYQHRTVYIDGVVTNSWGGPFVPFTFYRVADGTGELTVLSQGYRTPTRGARVRVKGRVDEIAVFGGRPLGLHLREEDLRVKR